MRTISLRWSHYGRWLLLLALAGCGPHDDQERDGAADALLLTEAAPTPVMLVAAHSRKCLDVAAGTPTAGAGIVQNTCATAQVPKPSQQWVLTPMGENRYNIVNRSSGLCLDVSGSSQADGAAIRLSECRGATKYNQLWTLQVIDGTWQAFAAVHSNKCLDVFVRSQDDGAPVIQWTCSSKALNQQWSATAIPQEAPPWGKPDGVVTTEVLFTTSVYTEQNNEANPVAARIDLMSVNDLTPLTHYKGATYFVWTDTRRRTYVTRIKDGVKQTVPLDAASDYIRACNGHGRYSLGIDPKGFVHIVGDMHNYTTGTLRGDDYPYPARYQKQSMLYWRSKSPESVADGFEFVGGKGSATALPGTGWTLCRFFTDNNGELYNSCRVKAIEGSHEPGEIGLGIYRYDTTARVWTALGALAPKIRDANYYKVVLWEQGGFSNVGRWFQGIMPMLKFDGNNRLHIASSINTDPTLPGNDRIVYAAAVDSAASTWRRANGTLLVGPLVRGASGLPASADVVAQNRTNPNFGLITGVVVDRNGTPGVMQDHKWYYWNGVKWVIDTNIPWSSLGLMASNKSLIMTEEATGMIYAQPVFGKPVVGYRVQNFKRFIAVDAYALAREGVIYAIGIDNEAMTQNVLKITIK